MKNPALVALALIAPLIIGLIAVVMMMGEVENATRPCGPDPGVLNAGSVTGPIPNQVGSWNREQLTNAAAIIDAGASAGVSRHGQTIGVMTAMGESTLRVLDYGDSAGPDSRGLFQQRANGAWGSLADRMDPHRSALNFFKALVRVPGWESLPPTIAAHRAQINADPYHYEPYWDDAVEVVAALAPAAGTASPVAATGDPYSLGDVEPQLRSLVARLAPMFNITTVGGYRPSATDPNGHPAGLAADFMVPMATAGKAQGQALADYARLNAAALNVDYIIWYQQIWSTARGSEGWRSMSDRGSPTANHLDHVHINVKPDVSGTGEAGGVLGVLPTSVTDFLTCATPSSGLGTGAVVFPVADESSNQRNWGEYSSLRASWHTGTDFSVPCGTAVRASHGGTVSIEASSWGGPQLTKVSTGPTALTTWYAHMESVAVQEGDTVAAGQKIGAVGSLGNSTGCHLHFEVHLKNGDIYGPDNVDPSKWLNENVGKFLGGTSIAPLRVATFNALGAGHTDRGGNRASWPDSVDRTLRSVKYFTSYAPDIIGMQEFQPGKQVRTLLGQIGGAYGYVGQQDNAVMWRRDLFRLVSKTTLRIPYFGGANRLMPVVRLQQLSTGAVVTVISVHNPANAHRPAAQFRARAIALERDLVQREAAAGKTVFLLGDFNDREAAFCPLTAGGLMVAANGGSNAGTCRPPPSESVDWIFSSSNVGFNDYVSDTAVKRQRISDHPFVVAGAGART